MTDLTEKSSALDWWITAIRTAIIVIVGAVFLSAGITKFLQADSTQFTMLSRYFKGGDSLRAIACLEIALALWIFSVRMPRLAMAVSVLTLVSFMWLIGIELRKTEPLPCGCFELKPGLMDPHKIRLGLWMGMIRNLVLILLSIFAIATTPDEQRDE